MPAMKIYLVGGAVRDELLGRPIKDKDYVVIGGDEAALSRQLPGLKCVGSRHRVYLYRGAEYTLSEADTIEADLLRRDLTINAVAKGPDGGLIGAPGALEDLRNQVLRPVAEHNFFDDPLFSINSDNLTTMSGKKACGGKTYMSESDDAYFFHILCSYFPQIVYIIPEFKLFTFSDYTSQENTRKSLSERFCHLIITIYQPVFHDIPAIAAFICLASILPQGAP